MRMTYEQLRAITRTLQTEGLLPVWPTDEQRADWAYGQAALESDDVTMKMAVNAVQTRSGRRS